MANSSKLITNAIRKLETSAGESNGSVTRRKASSSLDPRSRAASTIDCSSVRSRGRITSTA